MRRFKSQYLTYRCNNPNLINIDNLSNIGFNFILDYLNYDNDLICVPNIKTINIDISNLYSIIQSNDGIGFSTISHKTFFNLIFELSSNAIFKDNKYAINIINKLQKLYMIQNSNSIRNIYDILIDTKINEIKIITFCNYNDECVFYSHEKPVVLFLLTNAFKKIKII